jgi:hypothetical protein
MASAFVITPDATPDTTPPLVSRTSSGPQRRGASVKSRVFTRPQEIRAKSIQKILGTQPSYDDVDYDDVDFEIEDIQEYLVTSIETFIKDVLYPVPESQPSLLTKLNDFHKKIINPANISAPIYFKKWMIDQAVNGRHGMVILPITLPELKNIGLYDYFLDDTDKSIKLLLRQLVMYILALRTGDLSYLPDIASEIKPSLV